MKKLVVFKVYFENRVNNLEIMWFHEIFHFVSYFIFNIENHVICSIILFMSPMNFLSFSVCFFCQMLVLLMCPAHTHPLHVGHNWCFFFFSLVKNYRVPNKFGKVIPFIILPSQVLSIFENPQWLSISFSLSLTFHRFKVAV